MKRWHEIDIGCFDKNHIPKHPWNLNEGKKYFSSLRCEKSHKPKCSFNYISTFICNHKSFANTTMSGNLNIPK